MFLKYIDIGSLPPRLVSVRKICLHRYLQMEVRAKQRFHLNAGPGRSRILQESLRNRHDELSKAISVWRNLKCFDLVKKRSVIIFSCPFLLVLLRPGHLPNRHTPMRRHPNPQLGEQV